MTGKPTREREAPVRYESLETMPGARPLSDAFRTLDDGDAARRASEDPDAGAIPDGFWDNAEVTDPDAEGSVTLHPDPEVVRWFRSQGAGYRSRTNAVLKSDVEAQKKAG